MRFHKGAFDLDVLVCPAAIQYDKRYVDPYWHTRSQAFSAHLAYLLTRWCLVADVWWLPPQRRGAGEDAVGFAARVRARLAAAAGLRPLAWDGYLKHAVPPPVQRRLARRGQRVYAAARFRQQVYAEGHVVSQRKRRRSVAVDATAHGDWVTDRTRGDWEADRTQRGVEGEVASRGQAQVLTRGLGSLLGSSERCGMGRPRSASWTAPKDLTTALMTEALGVRRQDPTDSEPFAGTWQALVSDGTLSTSQI